MYAIRSYYEGPPATISARMAGRTWAVTVAGQRPRDLHFSQADGPGAIISFELARESAVPRNNFV